MRKKMVAGNWKMNMTPSGAVKLAEELKPMVKNDDVDVVFCVPAIDIVPVVNEVKDTNIKVGAENMFYEEKGAYTGELSPEMLVDAGVSYVIIGHSERRQYHGETNEIVAAKAKIAIEHGLRPIVCVGETLEERESGRTSDVVIGQLNAVLDAIGPEALVTGAVAYEPVWAIGTGKTATPQQAQLVHAELRDSVESRDSQAASALRIIYGGSVKPSNAAELFACNDIDGGLVGGVSLKAADFYAIAQGASGIGLI